jgi:M6 family metalloprotease-like protein
MRRKSEGRLRNAACLLFLGGEERNQEGNYAYYPTPCLSGIGGWGYIAQTMRRFRHITVLLLAVLSESIVVPGRSWCGDTQPQCGLHATPHSLKLPDEIGGKHMPARGVVRVLVVFASFPDDETPHPYWPAHQPPLFMRQFIDPDTLTRSTEIFNLTHYFRVMSLGLLQLVGDVIWLESTHSQTEYLNGSFGRANTDLISNRLDSLVDFSRYDNWTRVSNYSIIDAPDGVVDMIIMVWRTTEFGLLGEASLGYKPAIPVDGVRVEMGFPESYPVSQGSGVTCEYPYSDGPQAVMKSMVHELGHWLLGGAHPYSSQLGGKHQYWGMICAGQRISSCANAYEREQLGWIAIPEIPADKETILRDYVESGDALKFHPANGDELEYLYLENHQQRSVFDDVTTNPDDKGVWVLQQQGPYMDLDNIRIRASDGNWEWVSPGVNAACFGQALPVFQRGVPRVNAGLSHRDQITTATSAVNWMLVLKNDSGATNCGSFLGGEGFRGAFDTVCGNVFSPFSNPITATWSARPSLLTVEVVKTVKGDVTVRSYSNSVDASPARRYLGADPTDHSVRDGRLSLAWGSQWSEGQPLENDFAGSALERKIDVDGIWSPVYGGVSTQWTDTSLVYDSIGTIPVSFRVKVVDTQGKWSVWSNTFHARGTHSTGVMNSGTGWPTRDELLECYPNPFNPSTTIRYSVSGRGTEKTGTEYGALGAEKTGSGGSGLGSRVVRLVVYDLLGREVAVLMNESKAPGGYEVTWDASGFAAGVYICRMTAGEYVGSRKILFLK